MKVYEKVPDRKHNAATKRTNERENAVFFSESLYQLIVKYFLPTARGLLYETCFLIFCDNVCDAKKVSELMRKALKENM